MVYCITVLVEKFEITAEFCKPQVFDTPWGEATRTTEFGRLYWGSNNIHVTRQPSDFWPWRSVSATGRDHSWICLNIGNIESSDPAFYINYFSESELRLQQQDELIALLRRLVSNQTRWMVLFEKDCDQSEGTYQQSLEELLDTVAHVFNQGSKAAQGFWSYFLDGE